VTFDQELFRELDRTIISKVKIGNGARIAIKGKGTVAIESLSGLKLIPDVLYVPEIDQNLLNVGQLLEKGFKVLFQDKSCMIKDVEGRDMFKVKMKSKSFALNPLEEESTGYEEAATNQALWIRKPMVDLQIKHEQGIKFFVDN